MSSLLLLLLLAADPAGPSKPQEPGKGWFKPAEVEKGCVARSLRMPPGLSGSGLVKVRFAVQVDGTPDRIEVPGDVPALIADAIAAAVRDCRFTPGRRPDGTRAAVWTTLPLRFVDESGAAASPAPATAVTPAAAVAPTVPSPAAPASAAGTSPREAEPGCIARQLHYRFPPNRLLHGLLVMRVALSAEGKPQGIELPSDLPDDVVNAFRLSVEGCAFQPATGPGGAAVAGTFEYRVDFSEPGERERVQAAAGLKREARLASTTCLQRLRRFGVIGHAVVQVRVTPEGEPTNFRLQPENVPAELRLHIFDVLATCKWEPAIGPDDKPVAGDTTVTIRYK